MKYFHNQNCHFPNPVVTMGTFDGLHLGHQKLLNELVKRAREINGEAVVITYYHHPLETIYRNPFPYLLTEIDTREKMFRQLGINCLLYLNFTHEMAEMEPLDFLQNVLYKEIKPREFVIGYDTHFGKNRQGNYNFLKQYAEELGYSVDIIEPFRLNGKIVSSSWCREYIRAGRVEELPAILGRYYSLTGTVVHGNRIGHQLGFPTINLQWHDANKLIPKTGIYLSRVMLNDKKYWGVTNIGYRPTVIDKSDLTVETYILDFQQDVYGLEATITFEQLIRPEYKLKNRTELKKYISNDITEARKIIAEREA
ncbi:MAG: bifunctional riboflavin kinase/FAD synthetase [Candidatus Cloacimonetes bacterium]|nr:bifunctional riboflavin kinase/FAD synthetase [Candidatus Cloacimonadota bacterium]